MTDPRTEAGDVIRAALKDGELDWEELTRGTFDVVLPGERKLKTPVRLEVGPHALSVHAFVCRKPDENFEVVYRWLLERNMKMFSVAFALDAAGDIFLDARLPLAAVTPDEVDRLLGSVLTYADESFNVILELGFSTSIRKEWEWRVAKGESTANLEAFRGWLAPDDANPQGEA
ncbi:MAG: YbjN domain-containing protein [Marmoricola sp.]